MKCLIFCCKESNTAHDNIWKKKLNHSSIRVKGISVSVSGSGGASDKGQPSIIVSHLWAFVTGSVTLLIPTMLACLQWTGAHQLGSVLVRPLWADCCMIHKAESRQAHSHKKNTQHT